MAERSGMGRPRVVATGMGAITAQGPDLDSFWEGVRGGRVAIRPVERLPMDGYRTTLGGEVKETRVPEHEYRRPAGIREPTFDFALKAAEEALERCGAAATGRIPAERWGVVIGTCNAGMVSAERWWLDTRAGKKPDPQLLLLVEPQALAEGLSGAFGFKGPVLSVNTACAASANAIGYAAELIREGHADAMLTGGAEALSGLLYSGFNALESLSPKPAAPYSRDREGLSLGEGSGMIVLMREDLAQELGVPILAELLGYSLSADGYHPTAPHPEGLGAGRAIRSALQSAGVGAPEVGYVNSHGTGTAKNDPAETAATKVGLGDHAYDTAVSSTKSMIGHLLGAAGAVENIVVVKALEDQVAPPTANFTEADPECDLDYVPNEARPLDISIAISNNFAFGGANTSVVWGRAGARPSAPPPPSYDRIVVTGLGALTSAGLDPDALWAAHAEGRVASAPEDGAWIGRVELEASAYLGPKERKRVDRLGLFSIISSKLALEDAGLTLDESTAARVGVIVGTGVGPMESMEEFAGPVLEEGPQLANPAMFPNTVYNAAGGQVAMKVGAVGTASTVTAGHAAGASAICYGYDLAHADQADVAVAVGADSLTDTVIEAYRQLGLTVSSEPGSPGARGFALTEAGIALVLERRTIALARGARIYGELRGFGIASDALGVGRWDRHGEGVERAMRLALERAGIAAGDVTAVWAGANGLPASDRPERRAIRRLLGDGVRIVTPKVRLGEPIGAGASLNAVLALKSWEHGEAGPVLVNSVSLGGTSFSLAFAPHGD
jgi:3-oxoacyl-[acyl-carrier-protein] synthase II